MTPKKRKLKYKKVSFMLLVLIILIGVSVYALNYFNNGLDIKLYPMYVASNVSSVDLFDSDYQKVGTIIRGSEVQAYQDEVINEETDTTYSKIEYNNKKYLINPNNIVTSKDQVVLEKKLFVLTSATVYKTYDNIDIVGLVNKGVQLDIIGFSSLDNQGNVMMYKIKSGNIEGYVYPKYLVTTVTEASKVYDAEGNYKAHKERGDEAAILDFYPREKPKFTDNVMPTEVRAFYLNTIAIRDVDRYITLAKNSNINAFVVDIKEDTAPGYKSLVMQELSPKSYRYANNSLANYKSYIKKLKDNGFYVIGRITTFKDSYYVSDHSETAITSSSNGSPYKHNGSYWPSAYNRDVWEYNVKLAIEAVKEMGFNEIQFDYVRFPDGISSLQSEGIVNMKNTYNEFRSEAIQKFLMYATDEIHKVGAYVSADVFGESAHNYITSYGQYWGAISNVVDVISPMPYPDHFNAHEYGISDVVWTVPYKLLTTWGKSFVQKRQKEIPSPAIIRSWIQTYNTTKSPATTYNTTMVGEEIRALKDLGFTGGYMTWNAGSSYSKYDSLKEAFKKEY